MLRNLRFTRYALGVLIFNLVIVLYGAIVRASSSGDGCGKDWPLCGGRFIPHFGRLATVIEFAHRASIGAALPVLALLVVWGFRQFPKGHPVRVGVALSGLFTLGDALIGAVLVMYRLVAHDTSISRAVAMSAHLVNTFFLVAALALTVWWSAGGRRLRFGHQGAAGALLYAALGGTLLMAVTGSVTALVDTLYPSKSLWEALQQDIFPGVHFLIRLRLLHPAIAITVTTFVIFAAGVVARLRPSPEVKRWARNIALVYLAELGLGFLNVLLLAPMWMQLAHLLLADLLWINLVLLSASALQHDAPIRETLLDNPMDVMPMPV